MGANSKASGLGKSDSPEARGLKPPKPEARSPKPEARSPELLLLRGRRMRGGLGEARDAPRRLRFVDHALRRGLRDLAHRLGQHFLRLGRVARSGGLAEPPHAGAQRGEDARVADAVRLGLPVLLLCRSGIGHANSKN